MCNYGLNSHFKHIFKNILEKNKKIFPCGALLLLFVHKVFIEVPLFQEILPRKIPRCAPVTFILTFHPNFHPNILVFANLPIYRKLIRYVKNSSISRRIDVIISTWIRLSKSMSFRRTFHVEFRSRIDDESTRLCPLGIFMSFIDGKLTIIP